MLCSNKINTLYFTLAWLLAENAFCLGFIAEKTDHLTKDYQFI